MVAGLAVLGVAAALITTRSALVTYSTTRTFTVYSLSGAPTVTEAVIVQPVIRNEICIIWVTNSTSTAFLAPIIYSRTGLTTSTTTETFRAASTSTEYENVTEVNNGITCTLTNPYYNSTQSSSCPPCA